MHGHLLNETRTRAHQAVELRAIGQGGEGVAQAPLSVAVEVPLAREATPTSEDGQSDHLAGGEGGLRTGLRVWRMVVAEIVNHNVKCGEEGVHIDHEPVPFPLGLGSRPTLDCGHLPLKSSRDNSHQAFKWGAMGYIFSVGTRPSNGR
jgi:hypothetical protein